MYNGAEPPEVSWVIWRFPPSSMSAGPGRAFLCARCGKAFTRRAYLKRHQRAHQPVSGSLQCSICQKRFSRDRRSDLVLHCRRVHHQEAMESVYEAISPGSPLRDEQPVLPDDLLRQAAQQLLGAQQMEQQQPLQLTPLLNPALVVRAAPGAGAALHRQLQVTPSCAGVGVSLSVYGRLDQGDVMMQAHRDLPGDRCVVASVEIHEDGAAAVPTRTVNWDYRYEAMWGFPIIMDLMYLSVIFLPADLHKLAINCIFILTYIQHILSISWIIMESQLPLRVEQ